MTLVCRSHCYAVHVIKNHDQKSHFSNILLVETRRFMAVGHIKAIALVYNQERIVQESQTVRTSDSVQDFTDANT